MRKSRRGLSRRDMIRNASLLGLSASVSPINTLATAGTKKGGAIEEENSKPGTVEWQLQYTGFDIPITMASYPLIRNLRSSEIEGYVSKTSVLPGDTIEFKVSTNPASNFLVDIYRMGYYNGTGGRHMVKLGSFKGRPQPVPMMTTERLRECTWETSTTFTIPKDWPSGVYLGK